MWEFSMAFPAVPFKRDDVMLCFLAGRDGVELAKSLGGGGECH